MEPQYSTPEVAVGSSRSWMEARPEPVAADTALYTEEAGKLTEVPLVATVYTSATAEAVTEMRMLPVTVLPSEP